VPAALPDGTSTTVRSEVAAGLGNAPLAQEPIQALLAVAAATVLLGLCGLGVGLISASGERVGEFALLEALGLTRGGRVRLLAVEQALLAVPGAVSGAALGVLLAHLVVPAATLTAQATQPQPAVLVHTPWAAVWAAAALFAALPPLLAAIGALRRGRPAATVLRDGADR
jgi:ABC-type lipoprotein release transport system permease subunit